MLCPDISEKLRNIRVVLEEYTPEAQRRELQLLGEGTARLMRTGYALTRTVVDCPSHMPPCKARNTHFTGVSLARDHC
jgi:hypothetical protein